MADPLLIAALKHDEGCRAEAYVDSAGVWTIGYGHTGPEVVRGLNWSPMQCNEALAADVDEKCAQLAAALPWVSWLDPVRRRVLQNMAFNLGVGKLLDFTHMLAAVQARDWATAKTEMLSSLWARQVGDRARRLANEMLTGVA